MDDVKRLLEQFADRAVDGLPPADVDADVARGRRALRRIRARRRVTGVLCVAAATTAVLVVGSQGEWWGGDGEAEVATDAATTQSQPQPEAVSAGSATPSTAAGDQNVTTFSSATVVQLVTNPKPWNSIGCTLTPLGWAAAPQGAAKRVVLTPPSARTADTSAQLELFTAAEPQPLSGIRAVESGGKVFHVGSTGGREVGQVRLGDSWLVAKLPIEHQDWNDDLVRRFLASCTVS